MDISFILPILVTVLGCYLLVKLRCFFVFHPVRTLKCFLSTLGDRRNRRALYLALAGTLGVGNIFGVTVGIIIGGAGSVFWLLVSAFFSMIIKYSETTLAAAFLEDGRGMHHVIKRSFAKYGANLSKIYAFLCLCLALFMGASMQTRAVCDSFGFNGKTSVLFLALFISLILISVIGGAEKIEKITSVIVPMTTIIYIVVSFAAILCNYRRIDDIVLSIVKSAISPEAFSGGVVGFMSSSAIKQGFARGVLSNEAGLGTSAMAHTRADGRLPAQAGLYGICEVFFDTAVLCPLTAFMVLTSGKELSLTFQPMKLLQSIVLDTLGEPFNFLLGFLVLAFGYSTVTCWYYYGGECLSYLRGKDGKGFFLILYISFVIIGVTADNGFILYSTDMIILSMSILVSVLLVK
ncbi:MAG: alanine:cation symporter family protein, partial [Clostridia bacterium]|nr:alanine:cation symporter family protein [Clostridia bacterium]